MPFPLKIKSIQGSRDAKSEKHNLSDSDKLGLIRTRLAYDRTLLAWIRTSLGITGFGFTFYKFFDYLWGQGGYIPEIRIFGPREYAILLIIFSNFALALAIFHHFRARKELLIFGPDVPKSRVPLLAFFIVAFGLSALIATLFRL